MDFWFDKAERSASIDGVKFKWEPPAPDALLVFAREIEKAALVYRTLARARDSFEGGRASYKNAADRLLELIGEIGKAASKIIDACDSVREWIPSLPPDIFLGFGDEFLSFCRDWVEVCRMPERAENEPMQEAPVKVARESFAAEVPKG